jgi:hypothetical protein
MRLSTCQFGGSGTAGMGSGRQTSTDPRQQNVDKSALRRPCGVDGMRASVMCPGEVVRETCMLDERTGHSTEDSLQARTRCSLGLRQWLVRVACRLV